MYKDFIEDINSNYFNGVRLEEQMSYLLFRKFGKPFVIKRLAELKTLVSYQPFESIDFQILERCIIKYLSNDSEFARILSVSKYIDGTHRVNVPDRKSDQEKINLLGYIDKLSLENDHLIIKYDFFKENQVSPRKLPIEAFRNIQMFNENLGQRGEEYVFNLEKERLPGMPLKMMSLEDVKAGFDILSYRNPNDVNTLNQLMIEVKTFKNSFHFFVSNNEYNTHTENPGRHIFVIIREDESGILSIYKVIEDLELFLKINPTLVTIIPTFRIEM
jgi:hypothetical protein